MAQMGQGGYISFADMFDGGGAGRSGDRFEGGLLSGLLNALGVTPYGYQDRMDERERRARMASMPPRPAPRPAQDTRRPDGIGATPATNYIAPQQYSGSGMNPSNAYGPSRQYSGSGMNPSNAYGPSQLPGITANPMAGMDQTLNGFNIYREPMTGEMMMNNNPIQSPLTPQELELYRYIYGAGGYR